jgi:hypothetical protein
LNNVWENLGRVLLFNYGKQIHIDLESNKLFVKIYGPVISTWNATDRKYLIKNKVYIKLKLPQRRSLLDYLHFARIILDFFNFMSEQSITFAGIEGIVNRNNKRNSVIVLFHSPISEHMNKIPQMIPYDLRITHFETFVLLLNRWFNLRKEIRTPYDLYFGTIYEHDLNLPNRLLMLCEAIESYHKNFLEMYSIKKNESEKRVERVLDKIEDILLQDPDKKWLQKIVQNQNSLSFRERIIEVYNKYSDLIPNLATKMPDKSEFSKKVRDYRNELAHGVTLFDEVNNEDLFWTVESLHFLIKLLFVTHLGFKNEEIMDLFLYRPLIKTTNEKTDSILEFLWRM